VRGAVPTALVRSQVRRFLLGIFLSVARVSFRVLFHGVRRRKATVAVHAPVRLLARVRACVLLQVGRTAEALAAVTALVRLLAAVHAHVALHAG